MGEITSRLKVGKAIARDFVTDDIYSEVSILRDVWSVDWNDGRYSKHFECRLVALNKDHPKVPTYDRFRPIVVSSPVVKLLESRFLPPLEAYLRDRLHPSQTGFVSDCSIFLNITRVIDRIRFYFAHGTHVYGVFVDFSNAYNTILHSQLFERLRGILRQEEIEFLRSMYSKFTIHAGKHCMKPNIGVAQGSILSPALFNIYMEPLIYAISEEISVGKDDTFAYADDLLILTSSRPQVTRIIETIEKFSSQNGLKLNKSKSAIVEFFRRHSRSRCQEQSITGIPVVTKYKYLGLWLNQKLKIDDQLAHIKRKSWFIKSKLGPVLQNVSLEYRKNLWNTFIRPMIEFCLPIFATEPARTNREKITDTVKRTFKLMTSLSSTTPDYIVRELCGLDIESRGMTIMLENRQKWQMRKGMLGPGKTEMDPAENRDDTDPQVNLCRYIPKTGIELLNMYTMVCPKCPGKVIMNSNHLKVTHGLEISDPLALLRHIASQLEDPKPEQPDTGHKQKKKSRTEKMFSAHLSISKDLEQVRKLVGKAT